MSQKAQQIFETELERRGIAFEIEPESGRYVIEKDGGRFLVSLHNLVREFDRDQEPERIIKFVESFFSDQIFSETYDSKHLYWNLEPNDYQEPADFRHSFSDRVDRVLVHVSADAGRITWVTSQILDELSLSADDAGDMAFHNLALALAKSNVEYSVIDDVRLGMIATHLPFKASLILAPNLREIIEPLLGWPLYAVAPARDFLYLWDCKHSEFAGRVGEVVVREFTDSPYPISPEVFEISDNGIEAIGEFPTD